MAYLPQMTPQCPATSPCFSPYLAGGANSTVPLELLYGLVRHRTQNREARRRFRECKEQRQQTLQQKVDDIRLMYLALSEEHAKSTIEVARLQQENNTLRSEVKDLHRQWRLTQTVLQWSQQSSQSPLSAGGDAGLFGYAPYCLGDLTDDPSPYHSPS
ncbi:hypothetical protein EDB81DRAFT_632937 [Dactylonectria macrodidyma]|uniref:BZIP domain-containing protein n=1 Tax=Dactylonectria macrodidyma TaxID=307937 RepID=A0A9P9FUH5_9HYPO|nr:hypothetical protein EDB81DRAFT_632937 [Dactylonectria macrodidyma]